MKAKLLVDRRCRPSKKWPAVKVTPAGIKPLPAGQKGLGFVPAGTILEDPPGKKKPRGVWLLVCLGLAVPADEECEKAAGMTAEQMLAAQHSSRRARAGIMPEDWDKYDRGLIAGYNADGSPIPGPNADNDYEIEDDDE